MKQFIPPILVAMIFICFSEGALAQNAKTREQKVAELAQGLLPAVRTLSRPITVYHYGSRGIVFYDNGKCVLDGCQEIIDLKRNGQYDAAVELNPPEVKTYFKSLTAMFAAHQEKNWNMGGGLYAAVDPIQSITYAHGNWFLLEITLPIGTKYLDARKVSVRVPYSTSFDRKLEAFMNSDIAIDAIASLGVDAIAYGWNNYSQRICNGDSFLPSTAFNLISPEAFSKFKINLFTENVRRLSAGQSEEPYRNILERAMSIDWIIKNDTVVSGNDLSDTYKMILTVPVDGLGIPEIFEAWKETIAVSSYSNQEKKDILGRARASTFGCSVDSKHQEESLPPEVLIKMDDGF